MTGHRIHIKGFTEKSGKLKRKASFARTLAQKKAASTKQRFVKAAKSINRK